MASKDRTLTTQLLCCFSHYHKDRKETRPNVFTYSLLLTQTAKPSQCPYSQKVIQRWMKTKGCCNHFIACSYNPKGRQSTENRKADKTTTLCLFLKSVYQPLFQVGLALCPAKVWLRMKLTVWPIRERDIMLSKADHLFLSLHCFSCIQLQILF